MVKKMYQLYTRLAATVIVLMVVIYFRWKLNGESKLRKYDIIENNIINAPTALSKAMTIGIVSCRICSPIPLVLQPSNIFNNHCMSDL